ncbi:MAG: GFA family protein [Pseudomonadota bacterium]
MDLPEPSLPKTGRCACGEVRWKALVSPAAGACHCGMCRRWTGGPFLGVATAAFEITQGAEALGVWKSSDWAERGFCKTCGSSLFYRLTVEGPAQGETHVGAGGLDDAEGLDWTLEVFTDAQPDFYRFAGEATRLTEAELMALIQQTAGAAPPGADA